MSARPTQEKVPMRPIRVLFPAMAAILLAACASGGARTDGASQTAMERAAVRWTALIEGRPGDAWDLYTPGVRSTKTREAYVKEAGEKPVMYRKAAPISEECDADACTVTVEVEYDIRVPLAGAGVQRATAYLEERWIRLDGGWFYLPEDFR
jgi:hypothetical protein